MNRSKRLRMNTIMGLLGQVTTCVCGFIVPKLLISYYGSEINGLVVSVTHFLSFISLIQCGMGVVIQASLYKPLAENDMDQVSRVIISSDRFFRKIGIILTIYVLSLAFLYPLLVNSTFGFWDACFLVLALAIRTFVQYYLCMSYRLLLTADQKNYIQLTIQIVLQIATTAACVVLAELRAPIYLLKLCTSLILVIEPLILAFHVKKHYSINKKLPLNGEPIKQKWNGLAQHVAYVVLENTDTVVLTMLSTLENISVYNVYYLVVNGIRTIITAAITGLQSYFGNLYAKSEKKDLLRAFSVCEWLMHAGVTTLYTCTCVLIVPFVQVYTKGVDDANYIAPLFGLLISLAQMAYCIRLPYNAVVMSAGHFKQTQSSAIIEAALNVVCSIALVFQFGLIGVAIGTLVAMSYRTVYLAWYLRKNILHRPFKHFMKHILIDAVTIVISICLTSVFTMTAVTYVDWIVLALKVAPIVALIVFGINFVCYPQVINVLRKKTDHSL